VKFSFRHQKSEGIAAEATGAVSQLHFAVTVSLCQSEQFHVRTAPHGLRESQGLVSELLQAHWPTTDHAMDGGKKDIQT
jgi:hypothetical protein